MGRSPYAPAQLNQAPLVTGGRFQASSGKLHAPVHFSDPTPIQRKGGRLVSKSPARKLQLSKSRYGSFLQQMSVADWLAFIA